MARNIRDLRRGLKRMQRHLKTKPYDEVRRTAMSTAAQMRANVGHQDAIASTELLNSISAHPSGGRSITIEAQAPYAGYVEFGTGPKHTYNPYTHTYDKPEFSGKLVAALTEWAAIKPTLTTDNPAAVGWAVALSISGQAEGSVGGTKPQPFFIPAWEDNRPLMMIRVEDEIRTAANKV